MNWIDCKDRLPTLYTFVLAYSLSLYSDYIHGTMTIARFDGSGWETLCNENENNSCACGDMFWSVQPEEITHWMPLPERPK